jgi:hypothetical protein
VQEPAPTVTPTPAAVTPSATAGQSSAPSSVESKPVTDIPSNPSEGAINV